MTPTLGPLPPLVALLLALVIAAPGIVATIVVYRAMRAQVSARERAERGALALARSRRDLEDFAYAASHDLRAPLRSIANLTDWLEEDLGDRLDDPARGHLARMRGRVARLETMVDDLLRYARAGRELRDVRFSLGRVAEQAVRAIGPVEPATIVIAADLPALRGDPEAVRQILCELIENALRHAGRPDVTVRIDGVARGGGWELVVRDDGAGIPAELHERIWSVFETVRPRDQVDGSGLGLAVVRKLAEAIGARAWVESPPGGGAAFHVASDRAGPPAPGTARR